MLGPEIIRVTVHPHAKSGLHVPQYHRTSSESDKGIGRIYHVPPWQNYYDIGMHISVEPSMLGGDCLP
jgi:hypothetical protein